MQKEREQNLIIVAALDRFAEKKGMSLYDTAVLFKEYGLFDLLRENYEVLHTQDIFEGASFASDYLDRVSK